MGNYLVQNGFNLTKSIYAYLLSCSAGLWQNYLKNNIQLLFEPRPGKSRLWNLRPAKVQISLLSQGSRSPDFGAEIPPHSQCQKVCFSQFQTKNSQFDKKIFFFFFGLSIYISQEKGKFMYWNQSSNGNVIHKNDNKFPNFSQNAANFPNSMGHGPIPKKGCESPVSYRD